MLFGELVRDETQAIVTVRCTVAPEELSMSAKSCAVYPVGGKEKLIAFLQWRGGAGHRTLETDGDAAPPTATEMLSYGRTPVSENKPEKRRE